MEDFKRPEPLDIKCTSTDCENGLHCFKATKAMAPADRGRCRSCGANLVDWSRVHRRDEGDAAYTFEALEYELIRHHHWHTTFDEQALRHAKRKGRLKLIEAARHRLSKSLAPAKPVRDGFQTPFTGNTIYYAQHAVACCCRTCLEYWHSIPKGRELTSDEFEYCVQLVTMYLAQRLPDLNDAPERVPPVRRRSIGGDEPERSLMP
jgi:hypothetical protein